MADSPGAIRERASVVKNAGRRLRAADLRERTQWLGNAAERLLRETLEAGDSLSGATGLSPQMVEWGARTTLETVNPDSLLALGYEASPSDGEPIDMLSLVLAGNLFTAAVRAAVVPLLLGVPVLAKAASRDRAFPTMMKHALRDADSDLGAAFDLVVFRGGDTERESAFIDVADAVAVYGGDETVGAVAARHRGTPLIAHGHGVSAAYVGKKARIPARMAETIAALSLDVCAYDQRGCLSPQVIYVEEEHEDEAHAFAERLADEGLTPMEAMLPRGPLPPEVGAAQAQWRGLAEVEGDLIEGDRFAIALRSELGARWSPGYRNVTVAGVSGLADAVRALRPLGTSVKCIGADEASLPECEARLEESVALRAYASRLGTMQTPALNVPADGRPIWHGLFRRR